MKNLRLILITFFLISLLAWTIHAQQSEIVYTVQVRDTLTHIAEKYGVSVNQLASYNNLSNPNLIFAGQQLRVPSTSPQDNTLSELPKTYTIQAGDSLFAVASRFGITLNTLIETNNIQNPDSIQIGQVLILSDVSDVASAILPYPYNSVELSETYIAQGKTLVVYASFSETVTLTANFDGRAVSLAGEGENYWGIVGVHALSELGIHYLTLQATMSDGHVSTVVKDVIVVDGGYLSEVIQVIPGREDLLSADIIQAEYNKVSAIWGNVTQNKMWSGNFAHPIADVRLTSYFGTRRSYGGGPATSFHGGLDYGAGEGVPIYAPAPGIVVMAEGLDIRGNAVLIEHGMGLFSGYWHQTEIVVQVGDEVKTGDLIGYVGSTGLVTGAHLHWEIRLGGIAVEPLQWVSDSIP